MKKMQKKEMKVTNGAWGWFFLAGAMLAWWVLTNQPDPNANTVHPSDYGPTIGDPWAQLDG